MTTNSVINSPGMSRKRADTAMKWLRAGAVLAQLSTSGDNATPIATGALVKDLRVNGSHQHRQRDVFADAGSLISRRDGRTYRRLEENLPRLRAAVSCRADRVSPRTFFFFWRPSAQYWRAIIPSVLRLIASNYKGRQQAIALLALSAQLAASPSPPAPSSRPTG
ncbi:MAG: hypothetical protein ACLR17_06030 [Enterobacteriaceae bacterium]